MIVFLFCICIQLLLHLIYARYKLFKKFVHPLVSLQPSTSVTPTLFLHRLLVSHSLSLSHLLFFCGFFITFFVQNKMASFWHWKKKYSFQPLSFYFFFLLLSFRFTRTSLSSLQFESCILFVLNLLSNRFFVSSLRNRKIGIVLACYFPFLIISYNS